MASSSLFLMESITNPGPGSDSPIQSQLFLGAALPDPTVIYSSVLPNELCIKSISQGSWHNVDFV